MVRKASRTRPWEQNGKAVLLKTLHILVTKCQENNAGAELEASSLLATLHSAVEAVGGEKSPRVTPIFTNLPNTNLLGQTSDVFTGIRGTIVAWPLRGNQLVSGGLWGPLFSLGDSTCGVLWIWSKTQSWGSHKHWQWIYYFCKYLCYAYRLMLSLNMIKEAFLHSDWWLTHTCLVKVPRQHDYWVFIINWDTRITFVRLRKHRARRAVRV